MKIIVNGEKKEIPEKINLEKLLTNLELPTTRIAIELNKNVIRKKDWAVTELGEEDKIEIIHFVGGG